MSTKENEFEVRAAIIADIVDATDTRYRGNLFNAVYKALMNKNQYFTAKLFHVIAVSYGINK